MVEKQKAFLEALFGESKGNVRNAMRVAGYSDQTSASEVTEPLAKEIEARTRRLIADNGPKAVFTMLGVLNGTEVLGVKEKIAASKDLLDRAGITKTEKVEVSSKTPIFFLPAKNQDDEDE